MSFVTTSDGVGIAVHDLGGTGAPVVLAHATGFHGRVWEPMAERLGGHYRCIAFDERGHGDSGRPPAQDFDWLGFGRDVLAVVDGLGLESPYGVGHSCGGTALLLAEQSRPGTFGALYCFEPVVVPADPPLGRDRGSWLAAAARKRREVFASRQEAYDNYASKPPLAALDPAALAAYVEHGFEDLEDGTVRLKCRGEDEASIDEMASAHDCFAHLPEVACPVLVAGGADTEGPGPALMAALAAQMPSARAEILPRLGHLGPLQGPEAVAHSVLRFLSSVST